MLGVFLFNFESSIHYLNHVVNGMYLCSIWVITMHIIYYELFYFMTPEWLQYGTFLLYISFYMLVKLVNDANGEHLVVFYTVCNP